MHDAGLPLEEVTPELHRALRLLEPFGMDNPEPVFTAQSVRLMAPPQAVREKHIRLRLAPSANDSVAAAAAAQDFTPRCHPDAAAIPVNSDEPKNRAMKNDSARKYPRTMTTLPAAQAIIRVRR